MIFPQRQTADRIAVPSRFFSASAQLPMYQQLAAGRDARANVWPVPDRCFAATGDLRALFGDNAAIVERVRGYPLSGRRVTAEGGPAACWGTGRLAERQDSAPCGFKYDYSPSIAELAPTPPSIRKNWY